MARIVGNFQIPLEYIPIYILLIRQLDRVMGGGCKLGGFKVYRIRPIRGRDLHTRTIAWGEKGWALFPEGVLGNHWGVQEGFCYGAD